MKSRLLVSAALLALVTASPAFADRHNSDNSSSDNRPRPTHDASPRGDHRDQGSAPVQNVQPGGGVRGGRHDQGGADQAVSPSGGGMRGDRRDRTDNGAMNPTRGARRDNGANTRRDNGPNTTTRPLRRGEIRPNSGANVMSPRGGAMATGAHAHNRAFDNMRRVFNAPRRFQFGVYHRPGGWYSHRWRFGEFLPGFFFTRNYWILDWEDFALDGPPPGTVWVRYGDDAVLIDEYTGEVIQVEYGIFY